MYNVQAPEYLHAGAGTFVRLFNAGIKTEMKTNAM